MILAGAPVTPPSSILFDYSVMGEKKASGRANEARAGEGAGGRGGRDKREARGGVVINGEAI